MHANNEVGNLVDLKSMSVLCRKYDAYLHSDTVQTLGHYPIDLQELDVDFISGSGHKIHGPKGAGLLYINGNLKIDAFIHGVLRKEICAGTENTYDYCLIKALELAHENMDSDIILVQSLKDYMIEQLESKIPNVSFNGDAKGSSLYTVLNVNIPAGKDE